MMVLLMLVQLDEPHNNREAHNNEMNDSHRMDLFSWSNETGLLEDSGCPILATIYHNFTSF